MTKKLGEITRRRGDTYPFTITVRADGATVDFTGYQSVTMSLNSVKAPADILSELFRLEGTFDADKSNGRVTFSLTDQQADNVGKYYYEVQAIDAQGKKRTYEIPMNNLTQGPGNVFTFTQDINKE